MVLLLLLAFNYFICSSDRFDLLLIKKLINLGCLKLLLLASLLPVVFNRFLSLCLSFLSAFIMLLLRLSAESIFAMLVADLSERLLCFYLVISPHLYLLYLCLSCPLCFCLLCLFLVYLLCLRLLCLYLCYLFCDCQYLFSLWLCLDYLSRLFLILFINVVGLFIHF